MNDANTSRRETLWPVYKIPRGRPFTHLVSLGSCNAKNIDDLASQVRASWGLGDFVVEEFVSRSRGKGPLSRWLIQVTPTINETQFLEVEPRAEAKAQTIDETITQIINEYEDLRRTVASVLELEPAELEKPSSFKKWLGRPRTGRKRNEENKKVLVAFADILIQEKMCASLFPKVPPETSNRIWNQLKRSVKGTEREITRAKFSRYRRRVTTYLSTYVREAGWLSKGPSHN